MLKSRTLYFAYGANISADAMSWRCPDAEPLGAFELRDWQLEFHSHATIVPQPRSSVHGVLWMLTENCEHALDAFEGYPTYYTKRTQYQDGHWFFFYEMADYRQGSPSEGYIRGIREGYHQWRLPQNSLQEAIDRNYDSLSIDLQYYRK
jgi:gamma-glutamylcyclotransferase (GGCT)/AIG2-like uncharacterized protein YtfP